nr:hypothetical protein [uncultured Acetatifactor sp.]
MIPELTLLCGQDEYVRTSVSAKMYRRYTEVMEKNNSDSAASAFRFNGRILKDIFNISERELARADIVERLAAAKDIHFVMQEVVTQKFLDLNPEHPEQQEKSAFDEYDEENGYNEEKGAGNVWRVCRENLDRVVKMCIRAFRDSYTQCMESDIMSLLDYVKFEILTINER